jgi:hypothetical protein
MTTLTSQGDSLDQDGAPVGATASRSSAARKCCLLAVAALSLQSAFAQESIGTVTRLLPHAGDVVIFAISGNRTNTPACSTVPNEWVLSLTTHYGRAQYAMLLMAVAQNRPARVVGWGTCISSFARAEPGWMQFEG